MKTQVKQKAEVEEQRMIYGEVYAPNVPDAQGDWMTAEEIRKMAHAFVRKGAMNQIDVQHDETVVASRDLHIVESFIAQKGDPTFLEGAWVIGMHIPDDETWEKIKKHEINGFSMQAEVLAYEDEHELEVPHNLKGLTTKSEEHSHTFDVRYDDDMNFLGGTTDMVNGHFHLIRAGTHTEDAAGHRHRFSSVDGLKIN